MTLFANLKEEKIIIAKERTSNYKNIRQIDNEF
jgi:hypothetical protein